MLITNGHDQDRAPIAFYNHCGRTRWSGMTAAEVARADLRDSLLAYSAQEGYRIGWNEPDGNPHEACPFHPAFMKGEPHRAWIEAQQAASVDRKRESQNAKFT